jgi:hypothetical protein
MSAMRPECFSAKKELFETGLTRNPSGPAKVIPSLWAETDQNLSPYSRQRIEAKQTKFWRYRQGRTKVHAQGGVVSRFF